MEESPLASRTGLVQTGNEAAGGGYRSLSITMEVVGAFVTLVVECRLPGWFDTQPLGLIYSRWQL
jgi:hypothetical protein